MKTKRFLTLSVCFLLLAACNPSKPTSSSSESSSTENKLDTPVLKVNDDKTGITWDSVPGATSYIVYEDEDTTGTSASLDNRTPPFATTLADHKVKVKAVAGEGKQDSDVSEEFAYTTDETSLGALTYADGKVTWASFGGGSLEYKEINQAQYTAVEGEFAAINENGIYEFVAKPGYNAQKSAFYVSAEQASKAKRTIVVSVPATEEIILEDGNEEDNATLQEQYDVQKYGDAGWIPSTATLTLDTSNGDLTENNCVKIQYWHHSTWFKFEKEFDQEAAYDTLSFYARGDGTTYFNMCFAITEHIEVGGIDLIGSYISYPLAPVSSNWTLYSISLDDTAWIVDYGGSKITFANVQKLLSSAGVDLRSLADLMPYFGVFQIRCNAPADSNGSNAYLWFDDIKLSVTGKSSSQQAYFDLAKEYNFVSDSLEGKMIVDGDSAVISFEYQSNPVELPVTLSKDNDTLRLVCEVPNYDFDMTVKVSGAGRLLTLKEVTGSAAALLANVKAGAVNLFDDFESYTETGVGYDKNHTIDQRKGLRAGYFSEYYTGNNGDDFGGDGWEMMGSSDYLDLYKGSGHNDSNCARIKLNSSCDMRFVTFGLLDGSSKPNFGGNTFSIWLKGYGGRDVTVKIRLFTVNKVARGTADNNCITGISFTVPKNSDWTQYTWTVKETLVFYGFSINPAKDYSEDGNTYVYMDDVSVMTSFADE